MSVHAPAGIGHHVGEVGQFDLGRGQSVGVGTSSVGRIAGVATAMAAALAKATPLFMNGRD